MQNCFISCVRCTDVSPSPNAPERESSAARSGQPDADRSRSRDGTGRATRLYAHAGGRGARRKSLDVDRRVLPLIETVEMPWGTRLIPADELKRLIAEQRRSARARAAPTKRGRPRVLSSALVDHIRGEREAGRSLRQIATDLNDRRVPTAQGGAQWWPSTVRAVLGRSSGLASRNH
jgi:hypothetical protein